ncbi:MAG: hypothetical protein V4463_02875 [Pseudomonadota bacterium]
MKINPNAKIKKTRIVSTAQGYYHDLHPYKFHATQADAKADRSRLAALGAGAGVKSRSPRVSTFYTFLQDKRKNSPTKFGNVPQGPHTFPHHGVHVGIARAAAAGRLDAFDSLIPTPAQFGKLVDLEIPANHAKRLRASTAMSVFNKKHKRRLALKALGKKRTEAQDIKFAHATNELVQMHPYGSYAYKGKGASRKALHGKGESTLKPLAKQIDLPATHGFSSTAGAKTRSQTMLATLGLFKMK